MCLCVFAVTISYNSKPTELRTPIPAATLVYLEADHRAAAPHPVIDSLIYFGNDESAIDKCLTVKRGEADSIAKTGKLSTRPGDILASGYVSHDGVAQIASIIGIKLASELSEHSEVRSGIAAIIP